MIGDISYISSLGDLAHLYCGLVDVHNATRLCELRLGSQKPGYCNMNLNQLKFGTDASSALTLLKIVDVSNCPNLKDMDQYHPIQDAIDRCTEAKQLIENDEFMKGILYGR